MRCLLIAVTFLTMVAGRVSLAENLLANGGFEEGNPAPAEWAFAVWSSQPSRASFAWSNGAHSGQRSAKLIGVENAGKEGVRCLLYSQPVVVQEGLLRLSGWCRTRGACQAHLQIMLYAEDFTIRQFNTPAQETLSRNLDEAADWSPFEFDVNVKQGIRQVVVLLRASGLGEAEFDDIGLESVDDPLVLRLYPAEYGRGNALPLIRGAPSFARMMLMGDRQRIRNSAEFLFDLPEGAGDFGLLEAGSPVVHEGKRFVRFRVPISAETLKGLTKTISGCSVTLWIDAGTMADSGTVYYRPVVDGKELPEKQAHVRVLPPLPAGPLLKRFHGFFCWGLFGDVPEKLQPAVYQMIRRMGADHHLAVDAPAGWSQYLQDRLKAEGGTLWANIPPAYERKASTKGFETEITTKGKSFFDFDEGYYQRPATEVGGAFWDFEPENAMHNPLFDHPATVAAFARKEGLDPATLTEERLQGELRERFLRFRTWQLGQVMRLWAEHVHDFRPDMTIALCQGAGMPPDRGVDYKVYDDIPHLVHLPMIYTAGAMDFAKNVAGMREYLPRAKLFPMTCSGMVADIGWLAAKSPRAIYFDYVSSALLGCVGCSHWPDLCRGFDMEYVWEVARAARDIGCVENYLFDGQPKPRDVTVTPLPENEARIKTARGGVVLASPQWDRHALCFSHRLKERVLISVCNMHPDKPATVRVRVAEARGNGWGVYDPVSRARLIPPQGKTWTGSDLNRGLLYEVPASSLGMLVLSRQPPPGGFTSEIRESDVRRRFETRRAQARAAGDLTAVRSGNLEITWADMDGDGNAEVRLASKEQELGLGPSGNLWSWKVAGRKQDLVNRFDRGGACSDQFWWPEAARASEDKRGDYELLTREVQGGRAAVTFRRALSHWALGGLALEKTYSIAEGRRGFEVRVTLRNESPTAHEVAYWSHNCFAVGGTPTLVVTTQEGEKLFSGVGQPREVWAPMQGLPPDQTPLLTQTDVPALVSPSFALGDPRGPQIRVSADPAELLQLYRWWDGTEHGTYTLEWMYRKQKLKTGQTWTTRFTVEVAGG